MLRRSKTCTDKSSEKAHDKKLVGGDRGNDYHTYIPKLQNTF